MSEFLFKDQTRPDPNWSMVAPQSPIAATTGNTFGVLSSQQNTPGMNVGLNEISKASSAVANTGAADIVGAASKAAAIIPGIGPILSGIGTIASGVMNYFAQKDAAKAQERARNKQLELYREAQAEDTRRYNQEFDLTSKSQKDALKTSEQGRMIQLQNQGEAMKDSSLNRKITVEKIQIEKDKQKMDSMANAISRMTLFMNTPASRGQFVGAFGGLKR